MRRHKVEVIQVNLSSSFMVRTKCAICGQEPTVYYYNNKPHLWKDHRSPGRLFDSWKKWLKRLCMDWYMDSEPRYFHDNSNFSHTVDYKGFNPKLHHARGIDVDSNIIEYITCWSGCTVWAFSGKANSKRREITQRK